MSGLRCNALKYSRNYQTAPCGEVFLKVFEKDLKKYLKKYLKMYLKKYLIIPNTLRKYLNTNTNTFVFCTSNTNTNTNTKKKVFKYDQIQIQKYLTPCLPVLHLIFDTHLFVPCKLIIKSVYLF